jgi:hypothetical protein
MLNLLPLAGGRWIMGNRDREMLLIVLTVNTNRLSPTFGESARSLVAKEDQMRTNVRNISFILGRMKNAQPQQVKVGPAIHLPFEAFEAIDLPFHLSLTPGLRTGCMNGGIIALHPLG